MQNDEIGPATVTGHTYRVVLHEDRRGLARYVEFEAPGAGAALGFVGRHCDGRMVEVIEDGRSLGRIRQHRHGGFWTIRASSLDPTDFRPR